VTTNTKASELFEALTRVGLLREKITDDILAAAGVDTEQPETWPVQDFTFDRYDESFEMLGVNNEWQPSEEAKHAWGKMGFRRCWLNYYDGTEKYIRLRDDDE
jgi:hypothetical protein